LQLWRCFGQTVGHSTSPDHPTRICGPCMCLRVSVLPLRVVLTTGSGAESSVESTGKWVWMVVRFVCAVRVPLCVRVSRVCPGTPGVFFPVSATATKLKLGRPDFSERKI
jgi:hypothetical protein